MSRRSLITAAFLLATIGLGQVLLAQTVTGTYNGAPVMNGTTVMQGAGPTTPVLTYAAPAPTAGISNAGRAGISNSAPLPSTLPSNDSTVVYYSQPGVQPQTVPSGSVQGATPATTAPQNASPETTPAENTTAEAAAPEAAPEAAGKAYFDVGPSADTGSMAGGKSVSLGEVAAQFKTAKAGLNSRTLTNQDVEQMLNSKPSVTVAKNMPPLGPSAMPSGLTQGGAPVASQTQSAPSSSANAAQGGTPAPQPAQSAGTGQQTGTPPPASATQSQPAGANAATTPQVNSNQQSNDAQGKSKLPATATFLPLLGLLGVVSGGIGLLVRKFRR